MDPRNFGKVFGPSNFYCPWKFRCSFSIMEGAMPDSIQFPLQNVRSMEDKRILKENKFGTCASEAKNSTKLVMRRLAKENVITQGIKLAKIALSNPLVVFGTIIDQIEIYDNMIAPVVESFKYMSPTSP